MSRGTKPGQSGRTIAPDEAELWSRLAHSVDKVKAKPRVTPHAASGVGQPAAPPVRAAAKAEPAKAHPKATLGHKLPPPPSSPGRPAPLAEFDRRAARQVGAGKVAIEARLDLHGVRRRDARAQLTAFLSASQAQGFKTVHIITGKGDNEPAHRDHLADALGEPQRGVLRRLVPEWLAEPELRAIVLSFTTAGVRHGGNGALYVQLRRRAR